MLILNRISFVLALVITLLSVSAQASDYHSARTLALGGAGHAGPYLTDTIYLNPSFASFTRSYGVSVGYNYFSGAPGADPSLPSGRLLNATLFDGTQDAFQAGVGYTSRTDANIITVGASRAIIKQLGVGIGGKFVLPVDGSNQIIRDATFSTSFIATNWLHVVGIVDNLIESAESRTRGFYREYILGTKVNVMGIMLLYFDPHWTPSIASGDVYGHELGVELAPFSDFFFRFGQYRNATLPYYGGVHGSGWAAGAGWIGPRLSLDYGYSHTNEPQPATIQELSLTLYF